MQDFYYNGYCWAFKLSVIIEVYFFAINSHVLGVLKEGCVCMDGLLELFSNFGELKWQMVVMWFIGGLLIYFAIKKEMEPALLLPMGFGAILVNIPWSGAVTQAYETGVEHGPIDVLFGAGIANELFPLLLFIGIGAMIDFGPLLSNPKMMLFGAAAQFGIFFTLS